MGLQYNMTHLLLEGLVARLPKNQTMQSIYVSYNYFVGLLVLGFANDLATIGEEDNGVF